VTERADNAPGEIGTHTATCSNGTREVTIYVHSSGFDSEDDIERHLKWTGKGLTAAYTSMSSQ
jgi:hypothetical protein